MRLFLIFLRPIVFEINRVAGVCAKGGEISAAAGIGVWLLGHHLRAITGLLRFVLLTATYFELSIRAQTNKKLSSFAVAVAVSAAVAFNLPASNQF